MKLNERAMLVTLNISCWEGRKKNKRVENDVARDNRAASDVGSWWTVRADTAQAANDIMKQMAGFMGGAQ